MPTFYDFVRAHDCDSLLDVVDGRIPYFQRVTSVEAHACGCRRVLMRTDESDLLMRWELFLQDLRAVYSSGDLARMQAHWDTHERRRNMNHLAAPTWLLRLLVESNSAEFVTYALHAPEPAYADDQYRQKLAAALEYAREINASKAVWALERLHEALGVGSALISVSGPELHVVAPHEAEEEHREDD
jgi:hypothetical protein